jgi:hypothetical protein
MTLFSGRDPNYTDELQFPQVPVPKITLGTVRSAPVKPDDLTIPSSLWRVIMRTCPPLFPPDSYLGCTLLSLLHVIKYTYFVLTNRQEYKCTPEHDESWP